jgi:hypothetical protein
MTNARKISYISYRASYGQVVVDKKFIGNSINVRPSYVSLKNQRCCVKDGKQSANGLGVIY